VRVAEILPLPTSANAARFQRQGDVHELRTMPTLIRQVETKILILRGQKVLLSTHLAELYGVLPKVLVQAVKRNAERFPSDFMFQLNNEEFADLKSQMRP